MEHLTPVSVRPTIAERARYVLGGTLPPPLHDWVARDLTGPGALRRYMVRCTVPLLPIGVALVLLPAPWVIRLGVVAIVVLPYVYFAAVLRPIFVRHRLLGHSLQPPEIAGGGSAQQIDLDAYAAKFRSR